MIGDAVVNYREKLESVDINMAAMIPRASVLAMLAVKTKRIDVNLLEPYYHKKTQAEREKELREKAV